MYACCCTIRKEIVARPTDRSPRINFPTTTWNMSGVHERRDAEPTKVKDGVREKLGDTIVASTLSLELESARRCCKRPARSPFSICTFTRRSIHRIWVDGIFCSVFQDTVQATFAEAFRVVSPGMRGIRRLIRLSSRGQTYLTTPLSGHDGNLVSPSTFLIPFSVTRGRKKASEILWIYGGTVTVLFVFIRLPRIAAFS